MNIKIFIPLLIYFFSNTSGNCQNVFPSFADSAKWSVYECFHGGPYICNTHHYSFSCDTSFCGQTYSKVVLQGIDSLEVLYVRSDTSRAYCRRSNICSDKEYLMYDFSIGVGDTVMLAFNLLYSLYYSDTTEFVLDSIDHKTINNVARRIFYMRYKDMNEFYYPMDWIEGIGSLFHPFFQMKSIYPGSETWHALLCYDSAGTLLYQNPAYNTCDTSFNNGIDETDVHRTLEISPNPFHHSTTITATHAIIQKAEVYSLLGECIFIYNNINQGSFTIEKGNFFSNGIHLLKVQTDKKYFTGKLIITE